MKKILFIVLAAAITACSNSTQRAAEAMLQKADQQFQQGHYDRALITIDSLRKVYPGAIETRKQALRLYQNIELKRSQEELTALDSTLETVKQQYEALRQQVDTHKQLLQATPEELTLLTRTRVHRDSLQTRYDALCAKIRYIHKKQKEKS